MFNKISKIVDLKDLEVTANKLAKIISLGDVLFLCGELGSGKTTFARYFINGIFAIYSKSNNPKIIRSPTFNLMINYPLKNFQIYHYDLYRIKNIKEIQELDIYENIRNNITLIEWPEIIFKNLQITKYYKIDLKIESTNKRKIDIFLND